MGKPFIGAMMILVFVLTTVLIVGEYKPHRDALNELHLVTTIAARSACTAIDYDATAKRGFIVLDANQAESIAREFFFDNMQRYTPDESNLDVFVINDAPGTFMLYDRSYFFASNGVAVGYHYRDTYILSIAETDDF